jgi:small subunit ribosomal protein S7
MTMKIFGLYDPQEVKVEDFGLKKYINLDARLMVKSKGRHREKFAKIKTSIVERLITMLSVPGHRGKRHRLITRTTGHYTKQAKVVIESLKIIEEKTKQNPIQILVKAIENVAPKDEVTTIEYGGARYPQAVDCSPMRRISLALRNIIHGAYDKSFNKKKKIAQALAEEIIAAYQGSNESNAITKRNETEKQADSAR